MLLLWRGGMLMSSLRMSPDVIASRCSHISSMCHDATNGTPGSTTCQDCLTNSYIDADAARRSCSRRIMSSMTAGVSGLFTSSPRLCS